MHACVCVCMCVCVVALYPIKLLPMLKEGREPGRSDHVPHDILCVVLIIELLPMQSILSVISADTAVAHVVVCC